MQDDLISIELRLPGVMVLEVKEEENWIEVLAQYRELEADCPRCGRPTWQVHQWHLQRKRDARLWKKVVWLALLKRRFRCRNLSQSVHGTGSGLRSAEANNGQIARHRGGMGE